MRRSAAAILGELEAELIENLSGDLAAVNPALAKAEAGELAKRRPADAATLTEEIRATHRVAHPPPRRVARISSIARGWPGRGVAGAASASAG